MKLKYKSLGALVAVGSIVTLPILMVSCGTNILGTKANSDDWSAKQTTTNIPYSTDESATKKYSVKIVELWDGSKSDPEVPGRNAHFSNIIYDFSSKDSDAFWIEGQAASSKFAAFAKSGDTSGFTNNVVGTIPHLYKYSFDITVNKSNPYFTLATRFAPSPDWFSGFSAVRLYNNGWAKNISTTQPYVYANAMEVWSAGVVDQRFTKQKDSNAGGVIVKNVQMNKGNPFGYITITPDK